MKVNKTYIDAEKEAREYYSCVWGYSKGVSVKYAKHKVIEFYPKEDPNCWDTMLCIIDDGFSYRCRNKGELTKSIIKFRKSILK